MSEIKRLWIGLGLLLGITFSVLLWMGGEVYRAAPPMPDRVVTASGQVLYTRDDMETGRQVWQSFGGQQLGSIWGHGALVAPDWSADWLHREADALLDVWSQREFSAAFATLRAADQEVLKLRLREALRPNTYDANNQTITVSDDRAQAISAVVAHYESLFSNDPATTKLRETYAMRDNTVDTPAHRRTGAH